MIGCTTQYLYGNPGQPFELTAEIDPSNTQTIFFYAAGGLYALERGSATYYVATDQVGTPLIVSSASGTAQRQLRYTAYGEVQGDSNPVFDLPVGFAGGLTDSVTGLVRFGLRDYEPASGRWIGKDPIEFSGGYDLYVYAGNSPTSLIDPVGLAWAVGLTVGVTAVLPGLPQGGPGSAGYNIEFSSDFGLAIYSYSTPADSISTGVNVGADAQFNFASGPGGPWSGPFQNTDTGLAVFTWSEFNSSTPGWTGGSFGVSVGLPVARAEVTTVTSSPLFGPWFGPSTPPCP